MDILVITNLFPNPLEPQRSTFNERQLKALSGMMSLSLVIPLSWTQRFAYRNTEMSAVLDACSEWDGIPVRYPTYYYIPKVLAWMRGWMMMFSILGACRRALRGQAPRAILATWAFPDGFAAVNIGRLFGLPTVVKVHGSDVEALDEPGLSSRMSLWGLRRARRVVAVSPYLREKLVGHGIAPARVSVVLNGIDSEAFPVRGRAEARNELCLPEGERIILYVGRLHADKGLDDLLDALAIASRERSDLRIDIIGEGAHRARLEKTIAERALQDRVRLHGGKSQAQIALWMGAADCLCLPSHHEGIPNVILEALSCGLPVLATRVGGIPGVLDGRNGVLVEPHRPEDLAHGIGTILGRSWDRGTVRASSPVKSWAESAATLGNAILMEDD